MNSSFLFKILCIIKVLSPKFTKIDKTTGLKKKLTLNSIIKNLHFLCAEVVKLVDAVDSKSSELRFVPVRFRPSAPLWKITLEGNDLNLLL